MPFLIEAWGPFSIWGSPELHGLDFLVYGVTESGDPRVVPSLDMAREIVASHRTG